jgi:hypothetical protein
MDGYGLDPDEIDQLERTLKGASDALGMNDFESRATLEGFLTVQSISAYENVQETVEEKVLELSRFCNEKYPGVIDAMERFIAATHVTIEGTADGVAESGESYRANEAQVERWMNEMMDD